MKVRKVLLGLVILGQFLVGCSAQAPIIATQTPVSILAAVTSYPVEGLQDGIQDSYPNPSSLDSEVNKLPIPPTAAPEPENGKVSISGAIYSYTTKIRLGDTQIYLTPAKGEDKDQVPSVLVGPEPTNGDVALSTQNNGNFSFNNIPPGKYYLAVWAPYTWVIVQVSESDGSPLLLNLEAEKSYQLGILYVAWP